MDEKNILAERIRMLRLEKGVTQTKFARDLGKKDSTARMWELGKTKLNIDILIKLAE